MSHIYYELFARAVGFGDISPATEAEMLFACVIELLGSVVFAYT